MAYTYTGTPSERILQAKNRVTNESVNGTLSNYLKVNTGEQEQAIENGVKNASVGEKIGDTLGDIFKNIASGVEKAFEGIADFGASTVGVIAGWAGNDTLKDDMSKFVARDLVTEGWQDLASKGYDVDFANSAINDLSETGQNIVRGVSQGVGQMLPMVITTALTGGTSLATLGNVANWGGFAMSAAGTGTESALNDVDSNGNPVSLDRAYLYGLAEGAKELATEMIVGGVVWDKGILDNVVGNLAKNVRFGKLVKLGLNSLGEGFEEVVGEVFENTLQTIYKDDNFHWESPDAASVIENGIIGSLTAAVLGSGQSAMVKASNTMTIQEEMANLKENEDYVQRMQDKGNYDEKVESRYTQEKERATNEISKRLKKMTDEKREKAFAKSPQLATLFDAKGNIKSTQLNEGVTAIENRSQAIQNGTLDARITDTNKVANVLRNASVSIESGQDAKFKLSESLNETESKNLETFKKLNQLVGKDTGINTKFAVYEQQEKITNKEGNNVTGNAFINGDVVYINKSRLQNENDVYKAFAHEVIGHFTENTNEHNALVKVASEILGEERVSQIEKSIKENYKEDAIESEIDAHIVEEFLSEKGTKYIEELATKNESLAKKFKAKVDKVIKYIESVFKGDKEALQELKSLRKMSKLIEGTLAKGGMKYVAKEYAKQSGLEEFLDGVNTQFNIATWKEKCIITKINKDGSLVIKSGKEILTEYLEKTGMSSEEIKELYTDSIDKVSDIVEELSKEYDVLKDFKNIKPHYRPDGSLMLTCLVSNGEYELNIDFTTICKKRESLAKFLTEYQEQGYSFGKNGFNKGNQTTLENLLKKYGLDTACTFCFVEARRKNVDTWSEKFYTLWSDALRLAGYKNAKPISQVEALKDIDVVNGIKTNIDSKELTDELAFDVANLVESDALNLKEDNDAAMQAGYKMFDDAYKEYVKKLKEQYEKDLKAGLVKEKKNGVKDDTEARMLAAMAKIFKENPDKIFTLEKEDLYNTRVITYIKAAIPDMYSVLLTSYGANAPKQTLPAAPYTSNVFVDKAFNNKKKNYTTYTKSIGGTRMNSFSDFQISRVLDYVQYIADASAKGMCIQSYTKELAMVELFGKCGLKINMSLIPEIDLNVSSENAGLDANGNYIFSSDSADFRRTIELQEIDGIKGNCGSVLVGISDGQIRKALSDDRIKMIIPYHSSGMPKHLKVFFHHDGYYKDYQPYQNTKNPANPKYTDKFLKVFYESYVRNKGNSKAAADDYLAFCEKNKLIPRFAQEWNTDLSFKENLANPKNFIPAHENYYKVLIDFTSDLGNGKFAEQEPVKLNLNFEQTKDKDGKVLIDSFKNIVSRESSKLQENMAQYEKAIKNGIFDDFQKEIKENDKISEESVVKKQQAIRDERIQNKENKENTIYENIQFSKSVDSEGNQLSVEQEDFFKDSKARDENGNLLSLWSGTQNGEFFVFKGDEIYFTDNKAVAESYRYRYKDKPHNLTLYNAYLNMKNPLIVNAKGKNWDEIRYKAYNREDVIESINKEIERYEKLIDELENSNRALKDVQIKNFKEEIRDYKRELRNVDIHTTEDIVWEARKLGYDGVIIKNVIDTAANVNGNEVGSDYVVFAPNQVKNVNNYNPTSSNDIRFSKNVELTDAVKKSVDEIFNKETAEMGIVTDNDIHDIVNNAIKLAADTPRPYAELVCQEIADNIINKAHIVSVYYTQEDVEELKKEKQILDGYKHKFKFSEKDREEIKYTFDKDAKTIYLMWSAKNGGVETDVFYSELEGKTGFITESLTGIDQFKDFLDYYNEISNKIKSAQEIDGTDIKSAKWDNEILYDIRDKIRDDLIEAVLPYVDKSKKEQSIARNKELEKSYKVATETIEKLKKDLDRAKTRVEKYNQRANEAYERNKTTNKIIDIAKKFSKEELKKYPNASMLGDAQFNLALSAIAKLVHRGDLGKVGARKAIDKINEWYTDKNTFLQASDEQGGTLFNAEIKDAMESIVENTKAHPNRAFTNEELKNVLRIVQHIQHLMKTYDEFTKAGKKASVKKTATEGIDVARQMSKFSNTNKLFAMIKKFGEWIVEPRVFIRQLFGYQSNPISEIYEDIVDGETRASKVRMDILQPLSEFYKEHKNYKKSLSEKVTFMGKSITKAELISLYKYEKQEHSRGALHSTGFGMINEKTRMFEEYGVLDDSSVSEMNSLLNETDKAYIQAVEESMKIGAKYQIETDYDYKGFTFIDEDATEFYLPIKRWSGDFAKSMQETYMDAIRVDAAGNQSISKQRTNNVRRIQVRPIDSIVENYAKQCGTYAGLAVPIKNFERVLNFNIGSVNKPISIRNILNEQVSADAMPYLANLLNDIQGISDKSSQVTIFGKIRGNYAKFQLGANLKVIMSQMASYPTAFTELRASSMTKAFTHKIDFKDMDKYSDWAKARNYFDDVVRSEGILENVDKFTDLFTKPIQWTDRLTIAAIWNACQVEIETNHKGDSTYKYGTEENKKEAAKLLEHIGRTTQPNYTTTERTQLQRSKNEFMKTLAMFTAVPSKQVSRLIEAVGQTRAYLWKKKNGLKVTEQEAKQVKVYLAKTISAISLANIVYVMMGELVKFLFNKDREKDGEEISLGEDIGWDFLSTTIGMFPIVKNIYSYFVDGYDLDSGSYLTGGLEDILSSTKDIIELTSSVVSGNNVDSSEWYKALKSYSYGLGQVTGLPTRNIYNMVYGLTKRFDTSSAYKISSLFTSSTQYTKDLNQALKDGDENLATTIVGLIMEDDSMTSTSKAVNEKIKDLYSKGYSVLPKSVKDSVSYDGETYSLNANQQKVIKSMYQEANSDIESLIKSASFTSLDEAIQSRTIKWLYDYYYEYGVSETLGLTANSKKLLFGEMMDIKKFAMAVSSCQNLQADKDSDGNTINGSKKTKVESLLRKLTLTQGEREIIKAYLGYTADENVLKRYAKSVGLTKKQQEIFLKYC